MYTAVGTAEESRMFGGKRCSISLSFVQQSCLNASCQESWTADKRDPTAFMHYLTGHSLQNHENCFTRVIFSLRSASAVKESHVVATARPARRPGFGA